MKIKEYLAETKGEMKHVSWPTKKQIIGYTAFVIILSVLTGLYLGFFDFIFGTLLDKFILK